MAVRSFTAAPSRERAFAREEILAIAREAYFSVGLTTGIVEANEDFAVKLGFIFGADTTPEAILERAHPEDKPAADRLFAAVGSGEAELGEVHLRVASVAGQYHWLRLRAVKMRANSHGEARIIASFENIDPEKRREAAMELGSRRQDDLLRQIEMMRAQLSYVLEVVESERVWIWSLESGAAGLLQGLADLLGLNQRAQLPDLDAFKALVHDDDWPAVENGLRRIWQEGSQPVSFDYRIRSNDDTWQWVRTRGGLWRRDEVGDTVCAGTHAVVTVEREARARRDREAALFTAFLESAPVSVAMFDKNMNYIYASQRYCEDFGLEPRTLVGRNHYEVFPEITDDWKAIHRSGLAGNTEMRDLDRFERADGREQFVRWIIRPWYVSDGSIGGIIILTEEVTDRQRRAVEIAEDQERLRAALAIADAAVWEYDFRTEKFYGSERLAELAGRDHVDGEWARDFVSSIHPDDADAFRAEAHKFWSGQSDRVAIDHRVRRKDGGYRWVRSYVSMIGKHNGSGRRVVGFLKDIGSLKEAELAARDAEERALAANAAKSQFLATMSHEIRTPMNGVLGMASALEASGLNPDQRAMLAIIQSSGEDLLTLLNDLLDMSKAEAGKIELNEVAFYLPDLIGKVAALFSESAAAKGTLLKVEISPSAEAHLKGDALRIRQILNNLISNAVKFTDQGEIVVSVERTAESGEAPQTIIEVSDTGIGIAPDQVERVFEPFVQVDPTVRRQYEGTGLGLTISRRLVERMRGSIAVSSQPGKGSAFRVMLPLADASPPPATTQAGPDVRARSNTDALRVLVAEDNRKNQMVIEKVLSATGAEILFADDGKEAVARWRENEIDLILMDVRMPVADGLWASREIRLRELSEGRPRTPIIALTADATADGVLEAFEAGMDAHVAKPIQVRPLLETIASVVRPPSD